MKNSPFPQPARPPKRSSQRRVSPKRRLPGSLFALLALTTLLTLATTACQVLTYRSPSGERFMRSSVGANTSITSLSVDADTNGVRSLKLQGYQNDTSQALGAVTQAAVSAAVQAATKP